jgi:hypothetical protein
VRVALRVAKANASLNASPVDVSRKVHIAMVNERWEEHRLADEGGACGSARHASAGKSAQPFADPEDGGEGRSGTQNAGRRRICLESPLSIERQLVLYYSHVAPELVAKAHERGQLGFSCCMSPGLREPAVSSENTSIALGASVVAFALSSLNSCIALQFCYPPPLLQPRPWFLLCPLARGCAVTPMARFLLRCAPQQSIFQAPRL